MQVTRMCQCGVMYIPNEETPELCSPCAYDRDINASILKLKVIKQQKSVYVKELKIRQPKPKPIKTIYDIHGYLRDGRNKIGKPKGMHFVEYMEKIGKKHR